MVKKRRLDHILVERGLAPSRQKAQALVLAAHVLVNDTPVTKAGFQVTENADIRLRGLGSRYVGRGGDKLEGALHSFKVPTRDIVALDVGSSTGGFTDCLLQHGAQLVYAVDVGTNQLAHSLRADSRVRVMEQTHVSSLKNSSFDPRPRLVTIDVSFIGLRRVIPSLIQVLEPPFQLLALVKPQFELGPEYVEKGGVVRDEASQQLAVELVVQSATEAGLVLLESAPSVLKGEKKGNQEYFVYFQRETEAS